MIRPIDIRLNAAHPDLPLAEAVTYTGAPATVLIRGVPGNCGRWAITAVFVAATFPDGSASTRTAVQSANGVWVATLPATATSGRTAHGLRILADGADENGEAVGGYVLGVADFAVASLDVTPAPQPGETSWQMIYFDAVPGVLRKGDVTKIDGALKLYNGTAWEAFTGDIPAPSTETPAMDGTAAPGTSAAFARGDHVHPTDTSRVPTSRTVNGKALSSNVTLTGADIPVSGTDATKIDTALAGKASTADATLTDASAWACDPPNYNGNPITIVRSNNGFAPSINGVISGELKGDETSTDLEWTSDWIGADDSITLTATRAALQGYVLGSQSDKPLASEAEAEALRTAVNGKYAKPSGGIPKSDLASGVQNSLDKADTALQTAPVASVNSKTGAVTLNADDVGALPAAFDENTGTYNINSDLRFTAAGGNIDIPFGETGVLALAAPSVAAAGNLAALDAQGNPTDSGYRFEVRNGIPYIIETTND